MMRRLESVGEIEGVESVDELRLEVRLEVFLSAARRNLISVYCVVVVAANWLRNALLFVLASSRLSKWPSNWAM